MHSRDNWDDLRFVLAVSRAGSLSAAARQLGVNHATVLRRVAALEDRVGVPLFDKTVRGYAIRNGRQPIFEALSAIEDGVHALHRIVEGVNAPLRGMVRVTSTDTFCQAVLPRLVRRIHQLNGDLHIELMSSNQHFDLARQDADLVVRPAPVLPDELSGDSPANLGFGHYTSTDAGEDPPWIALGGPLQRTDAARWIETEVDRANRSATADSFVTLREMIAAGLGQSFLPVILAEGDERLTRVPGRAPHFSVPIWVAVHPDLRDVPRIKAVSDALFAGLQDLAGPLAGDP